MFVLCVWNCTFQTKNWLNFGHFGSCWQFFHWNLLPKFLRMSGWNTPCLWGCGSMYSCSFFLWNFGLISCEFANFINFFTEINLIFSAMALPLWGWPFLVWMFEFLNYLVFHSSEWKRGCVVVQVICPRTLHDVMMCWRGTLSDLTVRITCARGCVGSSPLGYSMVCHPGVTLVKSQVKGLEWPRVLSPIPHG